MSEGTTLLPDDPWTHTRCLLPTGEQQRETWYASDMYCSFFSLHWPVLLSLSRAGSLCSALARTEESAEWYQACWWWDKATTTCLQKLSLSWVPKRNQFFCYLPTELCYLSTKDKQNHLFSILRNQNTVLSYATDKSLASIPLSQKTCCKMNCSTKQKEENQSVCHFKATENWHPIQCSSSKLTGNHPFLATSCSTRGSRRSLTDL